MKHIFRERKKKRKAKKNIRILRKALWELPEQILENARADPTPGEHIYEE